MSRLLPDADDLAVWKLDESGAPFVNSTPSTDPAKAGSLTTLQSFSNLGKMDPLLQVCGPYGYGSKAVLFAGTGNRASIYGADTFEPQPPLTCSMWIRIHKHDTGSVTHGFLRKQRNISGDYSSSILIGNLKSGSSDPEGIYIYANVGSSVEGKVSKSKRLPLGVWAHLGFSMTSTEIRSYIDGALVSVTTGTGFALDYGTHGPWFVGAIPSAGPTYVPSCYAIADVRVAKVVRPIDWFREMYGRARLTRVPYR